MPSDQLRAEITIEFKGHLPENLPETLTSHYSAGDDPIVCAAGTALEGSDRILSRAVHARHEDTTTTIFIKSESKKLKVHVESLKSSTLDTIHVELSLFRRRVDEIKQGVAKYAKSIKTKIAGIKVLVSCGEIPVLSGESLRYRARLVSAGKANVYSKLSVPLATAIVSLLFGTALGVKFWGAFLISILAMVVSILTEALVADGFRYERQYDAI